MTPNEPQLPEGKPALSEAETATPTTFLSLKDVNEAVYDCVGLISITPTDCDALVNDAGAKITTYSKEHLPFDVVYLNAPKGYDAVVKATDPTPKGIATSFQAVMDMASGMDELNTVPYSESLLTKDGPIPPKAMAQLLMQALDSNGSKGEVDKVYWVQVAEAMGPDFAQALYHAAVFATRVA